MWIKTHRSQLSATGLHVRPAPRSGLWPPQRRSSASATTASPLEPHSDLRVLFRNSAGSWASQRPSPLRDTTCRGSLKEDVCLELDDGQVTVRKTLLAGMSDKLCDMLDNHNGLETLKVEGSARAWQFVAAYPKMLTAARVAALNPANGQSVRLAGELLPLAIKYDMPELLQECELLLSRWTTFLAPYIIHNVPDDPANAIWWIDLAISMNRLDLAGAAMKTVVRECSSIRPGGPDLNRWRLARSTMIAHGRKQEGQVWKLLCPILEGCMSDE